MLFIVCCICMFITAFCIQLKCTLFYLQVHGNSRKLCLSSLCVLHICLLHFGYRQTSLQTFKKETILPIFMPAPTERDFKHIAEDIWNKWNFSNCTGASDRKKMIVRYFEDQLWEKTFQRAKLIFLNQGIFPVLLRN